MIGRKSFHHFTQDLFYSWYLEQEEGIGDITNFKEIEVEDEGQLMLFVVSQETNKCILTLIYQVLVNHHQRLSLFLKRFESATILMLKFKLVDEHLLSTKEIYVRHLWLSQE
jgi:hypothetical protein